MIEKGNIILEKKIGIILVITNEKRNLEMLYASLSRQTYRNFSIYFVDNASTDGSVEYSKKINKDFNFDINYILLNENSGFAKGNNIGAKAAVLDGCDYLFVLNNDTELDKDCLNQLIKLAESDPQIGVVGPIFYYWTEDKLKNKIQGYGAFVDFDSYKIEQNFSGRIYEEVKDEIPEFLYVDFVIGGATFLKSKLYEKIGLWEEKYFIYGDEIDFSKRVIECGHKLIVTKKAKVWHNHNWSRNNKIGYYIEYYFMPRNKYLYFKKFRITRSKYLSLIRDLIFFPRTLLWLNKICNLKLGYYYLKGIIDGLRGKSGKPEVDFK